MVLACSLAVRAADSVSDIRPRGAAGYLYREIGRPSARWTAMSREALEAAAAMSGEAALALARRELEARPPQYAAAARWIERAAESGLPHAQYLMGYLASNDRPAAGDSDRTIRADWPEARDWYAKAAAQGHLESLFVLGEIAYYGKLGEHDIAAAADWWKQAATRGHVGAMRALGELYANHTPALGTLVAPQPELARKWYAAAAAQGDTRAAELLAELAAQPAPVGDDPLEVAEPFNRADRAVYRRGNAEDRLLEEARALETTRPDEALRLYVREISHAGGRVEPASLAAWEGIVRVYGAGRLKPEAVVGRPRLPDAEEQLPSAAARLDLARLYEHGNAVVRPDLAAALRWYLAAARAGHAAAMTRLGDLWRDGAGGAADLDEARRWWRRAAAGDPEAVQRLAAAPP
jgi:hypothetical protein